MVGKQDFVDYIVKHDFQPAQALEVATKLSLIDITTVKDFVGYFSGLHEGPTVFQMLEQHSRMEKQRQFFGQAQGHVAYITRQRVRSKRTRTPYLGHQV